MTAFSIPKKMFLKIESLMCALRAHVNRESKNNWKITQSISIRKYYSIPFYHFKKLLYQLYHTILQHTQYPKILFYQHIKIIYLHNKIYFFFFFFVFFQFFPPPSLNLYHCTSIAQSPPPRLHHAHHTTTAHCPPKSHRNKNQY